MRVKLQNFAQETNKELGHTMRLHKVIDFQLLSAWLKMADVRDVQLFWLVDQWVSEFMSSNSESGYFGTDNEALFFRELAENVPYLADLLVRTEGVNWKATSEVLKELLVSRSRVGNKGRLLAEEIVQSTEHAQLAPYRPERFM